MVLSFFFSFFGREWEEIDASLDEWKDKCDAYLWKCSLIRSSRVLSGKFATQRWRVSRTIFLPQRRIHGGGLHADIFGPRTQLTLFTLISSSFYFFFNFFYYFGEICCCNGRVSLYFFFVSLDIFYYLNFGYADNRKAIPFEFLLSPSFLYFIFFIFFTFLFIWTGNFTLWLFWHVLLLFFISLSFQLYFSFFLQHKITLGFFLATLQMIYWFTLSCGYLHTYLLLLLLPLS